MANLESVKLESVQLLAPGVDLQKSTFEDPMVTAKCAKCKTPFAQFLNSWTRVTNFYYLETEALTPRAVKLKPKGVEVKLNGATNMLIEGCVVQPLACESCVEILAFRCTDAPPEKASFRHREVFKLPRIILSLDKTAELVAPKVYETPNKHAGSESTTTTIHPSNPTDSGKAQLPIAEPVLLSHTPMEDVSEADWEAADQLNADQSWKDVHDTWERKTKRALSPAAFGKRIFALKGPRAVKVDRAQPKRASKPKHPTSARTVSLSNANSDQSGSAASATVDRSLPASDQVSAQPIAPAFRFYGQNRFVPAGAMPSVSTKMADARPGIDDIDEAVATLQHEMRDLRKTMELFMHDMRQELLRYPLRSRNTDDDSATLEVLSETVSSAASKAGEVDGLRVQVELLKRRVKMMEESGLQNPSVRHASTAKPSPLQQSSVTASQSVFRASDTLQHDEESSGWRAVNNPLKRKSVPGSAVFDGKSKKGRVSSFKHTEPGTIIHQDGQTPSRHYTEPISDVDGHQLNGNDDHYGTQGGPGAFEESLGNNRPVHIEDSQASWQPETHQYMTNSATPMMRTTGPRPERGRPRKHTSGILSTPDGEKDNWSTSQLVDADGYYQSGGGVQPTSPATSDRGRIVRRGSGGGILIGSAGKRARQKPMRNSEGILIRKDGRPDQRSISSANNLKKVHTRKKLELSMGTGGFIPGLESAAGESPLTLNTAGEEAFTQDKEILNTPHDAIMQRMFPNGLREEQERMDLAGQLFSVSSPRGDKMQHGDEIATANAAMSPELDNDVMIIKQKTPQVSKGDPDASYVPSTIETSTTAPQVATGEVVQEVHSGEGDVFQFASGGIAGNSSSSDESTSGSDGSAQKDSPAPPPPQEGEGMNLVPDPAEPDVHSVSSGTTSPTNRGHSSSIMRH